MWTYSVMPVDAAHIEERAEDIRRQAREGIAEHPLFMCQLLAKGNPVTDVAAQYAETLREYQKRLSPEVRIGVLAQSTIGHEFPPLDDPAPFQRQIAPSDGRELDCYCALDPGLRDYFFHAFRTLAELHPAVVMIDDDVRQLSRATGGCACPRHLAELSRRTGREWTREALGAHLAEAGEDDPVRLAYEDLESESLADCVSAMRAGLDSVDPTIQGISCVSYLGQEIDRYAPRFAGAGNPVILRAPNGIYAPTGVLNFSDLMRRAAATREQFAGIADYVISETDAIPYNRYAKSARFLHAQYATSLLEGLCGAKHWITRLLEFSPASGEAFRRILAENAGLYARLSELGETLCWEGCRIPLPHRRPTRSGNGHFAANVLERMGIPFYFSSKPGGAVFANGDLCRWFTDSELSALTTDPLFLSYDAAEALCRRGFGAQLGVTVGEALGAECAGEEFPNGDCVETQVLPHRLIPEEGTETASYLCRLRGGERERFAPAVTVSERDGLLRAVFCGTPRANHTYFEAFSFLNEARKRQLTGLLCRTGRLPLWYEGDEQVLLRCARLPDGRRLVLLLNTGIDPIETVRLRVTFPVSAVSELAPDGSERSVEFCLADDLLTLSRGAEMLAPRFLLLS